MADYKHGTYGEFSESIGGVVSETQSVFVYVGTAPVNLIRGYADAVNAQILLRSYDAAKRLVGYTDAWNKFTLCEPIKLHFDNPSGNIGPIIVINALDPDVHRSQRPTTVQLHFINGRASITSDTLILDTLVLAEKVEGVDFSIDYDFTKGAVLLNSIGEEKLSGPITATYYEVDVSKITEDDIIGGVTANGGYSGLGCVALVYPEIGRIPSLIAAPGWSDKPAVYEAMLTSSQKINGHWDAFVYADLPIQEQIAQIGTAQIDRTRLGRAQVVDTIEAAQEWQREHGYINERSKVFWPQVQDTAGRVYHLSAIAAWKSMVVDATHNDVPMESPSNKAIPIARQYFGEGSRNRGFDQQRGNELNAVGITTGVYWGGQWVLWGPHTAAYRYGQVVDLRTIFDNTIRMMMYVTNKFQAEHALTIDRPMTRAMADTIRNREQEKADALVAQGAFIGKPVVDFRETDNSTADLAEGNFVWRFEGTPTPPFKSGTLKVAYSSAGFDTYFGEASE